MADHSKYSWDWKSGLNWTLLVLFSLSAGVIGGVSILGFNTFMPRFHLLLQLDTTWVLGIGLVSTFVVAFLLLLLTKMSFTGVLRKMQIAPRPNSPLEAPRSNDDKVIEAVEALLSRMRRDRWNIGLSACFGLTFVTAILIGSLSAHTVDIGSVKNAGVIIAALLAVVAPRALSELLEDFGRYRES